MALTPYVAVPTLRLDGGTALGADENQISSPIALAWGQFYSVALFPEEVGEPSFKFPAGHFIDFGHAGLV